MAIIHAPLDDPAREHGLTLHKVGRPRRGITPPTPTLMVSGSDEEDVLDKALAADPPGPVYTKAMKRASSASTKAVETPNAVERDSRVRER